MALCHNLCIEKKIKTSCKCRSVKSSMSSEDVGGCQCERMSARVRARLRVPEGESVEKTA
jgi:hypothetical protein